MNKTILILTVILISTVSSAGDILILKNNMVFEGKVTKIKECEIVFKVEGNKFIIPSADIKTIQFKNTDDKVFTDCIQIVVRDTTKCKNGAFDAKRYHGKKGEHILLGMFFGPFAMIGTALSNPTPERGKRTYLNSENKNQFDDPEYLICYTKTAERHLIAMEGLGFAISSFFLLRLSIE